jgi:uncharacterized membrane protein YsdA (DUF1294 family)
LKVKLYGALSLIVIVLAIAIGQALASHKTKKVFNNCGSGDCADSNFSKVSFRHKTSISYFSIVSESPYAVLND